MIWTEKELDVLKKNYLYKSDLQMTELLDRSLSGIKTKRKEIGLYRRGMNGLSADKSPHWTGGKRNVRCFTCGREHRKALWEIKRSKVHFCSKRCDSEWRKLKRSKEHHNFKGGWKSSDGYIIIYTPDHPFCDKAGYVREHRLIVEKHIKRYLKPEENVHHINEIRDDNNINNLMLFPNNSEHIKFHRKIKQFGMTNPVRRQIRDRWIECKK